MLINSFFDITHFSAEETKLIGRIKLNAQHAIFVGHFPENPITPGVVQIQIIRELLEHHFKKELRLVSMPRCKFLKILNPNEFPEITITIDFSETDGQYKISAIGTDQEHVFFKISAVFQ